MRTRKTAKDRHDGQTVGSKGRGHVYEPDAAVRACQFERTERAPLLF